MVSKLIHTAPIAVRVPAAPPPPADPPEQLDDLLRLTAQQEASDLHLKVGRPPVLRIFGELTPQVTYRALIPEDLERYYRQVTSAEQRARFQRDLELDLSHEIPDLARFRINVARQRGTITMVMRRLRIKIPTLEEMNLPMVCRELVTKPRGLILVTGPTGSGKTTTLAAMIRYLNESQARRIVTCEDPIEYIFEDQKCVITQRELGEDTPSFASALKHALRQDPDVILVGEMRDVETIGMAITAAETGHLVLSTLHTAGAALTIDRIIDVFPPHQQPQVRTQLGGILEGVLSQTLLPKVGGKGQVPAVEVMVATAAVRNLIREAKTHQLPGIIETGQRIGMKTLDQALVELYRKGMVSIEHILEKASNPEHLRTLLSNMRPGS